MGIFAQISDVESRYIEGALPDDVTAAGGFIDLRIGDVEDQLIGLVPSLDGATPDELDPRRLGRVVGLICDKVLDLYRNPGRAKSFGQAMGDLNMTKTSSNGFNAMIDFTDEELNRVRLRTPRARFGTATVPPFKINTQEARPWGSYYGFG